METCSQSYLFRYQIIQRDREKLAWNLKNEAKSIKFEENLMRNNNNLSRKESLESYKNNNDNK